MEEETLESSYHPSFECCVCLELLFKPVVLACGHMSCFWCVHKAMHGLRASHCAICRQPYIHFPTICQLLHLLVSKMEPVAYKRREKEVLEEERRLDIFSPQFNSLASKNVCSEEIHLDVFPPQFNSLASKNVCSGGNDSGPVRNAVDSFVNHENVRTNISKEVSLQNKGSKSEVLMDISKDVLCALCQELLFQPTVLNCGHVFCESCLVRIGSETLKCHVCRSIHPGEFPKICWDLDHFLEEQFPNEYTAKRERLKQLEKVNHASGEASPSVSHKDGHLSLDEDLSKANVGVGCDSCGMYPIIGKRYKCQDCKEAIGFDLCESCYNTSSKLPGRFNQQHKPDHQFELDDSHMLFKILLLRSISTEEPYHEQHLSEDQISVDGGVQIAYVGTINAIDTNIDGTDQSENGNT